MHGSAATGAAQTTATARRVPASQAQRPHDAWGANFGIRQSGEERCAPSRDRYEFRSRFTILCLRNSTSLVSGCNACTENPVDRRLRGEPTRGAAGSQKSVRPIPHGRELGRFLILPRQQQGGNLRLKIGTGQDHFLCGRQSILSNSKSMAEAVRCQALLKGCGAGRRDC